MASVGRIAENNFEECIEKVLEGDLWLCIIAPLVKLENIFIGEKNQDAPSNKPQIEARQDLW